MSGRPLRNANHHQAAFTLLEVLLVVAIIAIASSLAVLSVTAAGDGRASQQEAQRLVILMTFARQQAMLENRLGIDGSEA